MAWFKGKSKFNGIDELKKLVQASPDSVLPDLGRELKEQDFPGCWLILKELLPLLDRQKARDLVRLVPAKYQADILAKVEERQDRELAIECLGYLPSRENVETLTKLLSHKDDLVQMVAARALMNHTPRLVVPLLVEGLLKEKVPAARAGEVLLAMGFLAQEALLDNYQQAKPQVQARFLEIMILGDNPKCLPLVEAALRSPELVLKKKGLDAVKHFGFSQLWTEVVMCLAEDDWALKAKALEVLAGLKATEALEFVEPFVRDPDPWVSQCAINCLKALQEGRGEKANRAMSS